jgi:hypothetical protein
LIDYGTARIHTLRDRLLASCLQLCSSMKHKTTACSLTAAAFVLFAVTCFLPTTATAQEKVVDQIVDANRPPISAADKETIKRFDERVREYVKLRGREKAKAPKLSKDSTPEQIQAAESAFVEVLRTARANAKPGDIFTPDAAQYIRTTLKREIKPVDKKEIRKVVMDKESSVAVPLRINYPYPDPKEFVTMEPKVLLKLPELPKEVKYRYVGRTLFLIDTDNNLIVDYMVDALP